MKTSFGIPSTQKGRSQWDKLLLRIFIYIYEFFVKLNLAYIKNSNCILNNNFKIIYHIYEYSVKLNLAYIKNSNCILNNNFKIIYQYT